MSTHRTTETMKIDNIPSRLKQLRTQRGWSLDRTAQATGVSKAMLGQIERGESSPTVATVWKIADGLNVSFSSLFVASGASHPAPDTQKLSFDPSMQVKTLFAFSEDTNLEVFLIGLKSKKRVLREPHRAGVVEHVIVTSGELEVLCDGEWHLLKTGGSMRFFANQKHGYAAKTPGARFLNIISYT